MLGRLFSSLVTTDSYILWVAIIALALWIISWLYARNVRQKVAAWKVNRNPSFSSHVHNILSVLYTVFTAVITMFPLLGMLGTVMALLSVDLAAGNMDNVKVNFFSALTSTAWGIIFSVIFKFINALSCGFVEQQIEDARKVSEEILSPTADQ